jgi:hypothetical protein
MIKGFVALVALLTLQHAWAIPIEAEIPEADIKPIASSVFTSQQDVANLINGSGLNGDSHDNEGGSASMWHTVENPAPVAIAGIQSPAWVRFDFATPRAIHTIKIWNHNQDKLTNRGFRKTKIFGLLDGATWKLLNAVELPVANGGAGLATAIPVSANQPLKAVVIAAESNWGGTVYGLSEVKLITHVAASDVPFPSGIDCTAQAVYRHRVDGKPGREIKVSFKGAKLYAAAEMKVLVEGQTETLSIPAMPNGASGTTLLLPPGVGVNKNAQLFVTITSGKWSTRQSIIVPKLRQWTVYIYPHSHVDIGYTTLQSNVEIIHKRNLINGMKLARETANYPEGARYLWNPEVIWPVERYLKTATPGEKAEFLEAIRKGYIHLDAGYINDNTSVTADEEFPSLFGFAKDLERQTGVKIDTVVQVDIPGMSWGLVPIAVQHGIRYAFVPFNGSDRTGLSGEASFRPFWWVGPDGKSKILFLQPGDYTPGAVIKGRDYWPKMAGQKDPDKLLRIVKTDNPRANFIDGYLWGKLTKLENDPAYPYDLFPMTWCMADNTPIDADLPDAVKSWNQEYAYPRLIIASSHDIMSAFEKKYGDQIPELRGDFTEYWTDGLGTSAKMTGMNRISKERLIQADTLWTMLQPGKPAPRETFREAWRNVLMGSEHTWCFMNPNQADMQNEIWRVKQDYFKAADTQSRALLATSMKAVSTAESTTFAVFNTLSWNRTGLVTLSAEQSKGVKSIRGATCQRLTTGELAFLAEDVPALGSKTYLAEPSEPTTKTDLVVTQTSLENALVKITLDPQTGDIVSLVDKKTGREFVDSKAPCGINSYRYLLGSGQPTAGGPQYASAPSEGNAPLVAATAKASGPTEVKISLKENGPLLASLLVEAKAEGCTKLVREVRLIAGQPQVELDNLVDKIATTTKEGIHFGFAFNIPNPRTRVDIPWGVMELEVDQLPYANRNWICFQRWLDISNADYGVTWCSLDAATFQSGAMTANIIGAATGSPAWIRKLHPSATLYSWALNNHWHTNFPLFQEGEIPFRYRLLAHSTGYNAVVANRFGVEQAQPLLVTPSKNDMLLKARVVIDNPLVYATLLKTAADGKATLLRLRSLSDKQENVKLSFPAGKPKALRFCTADETPGSPASERFSMIPYGVVTLCIE